jgi:hypothetical protein
MRNTKEGILSILKDNLKRFQESKFNPKTLLGFQGPISCNLCNTSTLDKACPPQRVYNREKGSRINNCSCTLPNHPAEELYLSISKEVLDLNKKEVIRLIQTSIDELEKA